MLWVRMQISTATIDINTVVSQIIKNKTIICHTYTTSMFILKILNVK